MLENVQADVLSLDGAWDVEVGGQRGTAQVPGVWERQGFPADVERAVYRRSFRVPADWSGRTVQLRFGAVSYAVEVRVNDQPVGTHEGLWTAFELDVTEALYYGDENEVVLDIIKPLGEGDTYPYREVLVGFIPYIAITFGGPWQSVELVAHAGPALTVEHIQADWQTGAVTARFGVAAFGAADGLTVDAAVMDSAGRVVVQSEQPASATMTAQVSVPDWQLWSPASPTTYTLRLRVVRGGDVLAATTRTVGFRALSTDGELLLLNCEPISARGVLSWGWKPETLAPLPTDDEIRDEFRRVRELGFNLVKLCLFMPPERVFDIADEEGMLLWLELPMWLPRLTPHLRRQATTEYADLMRVAHSHPSVVIYSLGCELGADMADADLLAGLDALVRNASHGVIVCDNSGSGEAYGGLTVDYADFLDYHFYSDLHYFVPLLDHFRRDWRGLRPWIFGEYCDSDSYRDVSALTANGERPWWRDVYGVEGNSSRWAYPLQEKLMADNALPFSDAFLKQASEQQSFAVRKYTLERSRSRSSVGGYVLTGLRDSPISTSGVFDDLDRSKFDPAAFRQFNADNVLLLEGGRTRDWVHGGDRPAPRDLYNHVGGTVASFRVLLAQTTLTGDAPTLNVRLTSPDGVVRWSESMTGIDLPPAGVPQQIASFDVLLPTVETAGQWQLEATLGADVRNTWPLWLYPAVDLKGGIVAYDPLGVFEGRWPNADLHDAVDGVVIASYFDDAVAAFIGRGGRAVLLQPGAGPVPTVAVPFWRESIKLFYPHAALEGFPHEGYTDMQFYHLATDRAFAPDAFGDAPVERVMQRLDARLFTLSDYVVDVRIGEGRLLASTLRFFGGAGDQVRDLDASPAARWLLHNMIEMVRQPQADPAAQQK